MSKQPQRGARTLNRRLAAIAGKLAGWTAVACAEAKVRSTAIATRTSMRQRLPRLR